MNAGVGSVGPLGPQALGGGWGSHSEAGLGGGAYLSPSVCSQCPYSPCHPGAEQHPLPEKRDRVHALAGRPEQPEVLQAHVRPIRGLRPHEGTEGHGRVQGPIPQCLKLHHKEVNRNIAWNGETRQVLGSGERVGGM